MPGSLGHWVKGEVVFAWLWLLSGFTVSLSVIASSDS